MEKVIVLIKQNRKFISSQLSKDVEQTESINNLIDEIQNWTQILNTNIVSCIESVKNDIGPVFNAGYDSEDEMSTAVENAINKTLIYSNQLIKFRNNVKRTYGADREENEVIRAVISSVEIVLKDLQFFYMNIEDALIDNHKEGHFTFDPDISTPFAVISNYVEKQTNQIEEQKKIHKSENSSWFVPIIAGIGLGFLLSGDDD